MTWRHKIKSMPSRLPANFKSIFSANKSTTNMEAVADASKLIPFRWRQNTIAERRRMRNDRKKRKRLQRKKFPQFPNAYISKPCRMIDSLYLARKYYLKWQKINEAYWKIQAKASTLTLGSRFGTHTRVSAASENVHALKKSDWWCMLGSRRGGEGGILKWVWCFIEKCQCWV